MSQPIGRNSSKWRKKIIFTDQIYLCKALLSVYDKTDLIDFAKGLQTAGIRLLGSGGTAKKIREAGIPIEYVFVSSFEFNLRSFVTFHSEMSPISQKLQKCSVVG
jgi:hypothetical protein